MKDYEISLGKKVRFTHHIERKKEGVKRWWEPCILRGEQAREGIIVGLRCLQDGFMTTNDDPESPEYGVTYFQTTNSFHAAIVAFDLHRKPVMVKMDDLHPIE